jgi:hypothetical protein
MTRNVINNTTKEDKLGVSSKERLNGGEGEGDDGG